MSEQPSSTGDYVQPPRDSEYIDVRETEIWQDFLIAMDLAEEKMQPYSDPDDPTAQKRSKDYAVHLDEIFGLEYCQQPSRVMALAYSEQSPEEMVALNAQQATYYGCNVLLIDDRWRVVLEFRADGTEQNVPEDCYHVPVDPQYIADLAILPYVDDDKEADKKKYTTVQLPHKEAESTQAHVNSEDFISMPAHGQRMVLYDMCDDIDSSIPHQDRGLECVVDCSRYYAVYDDMPSIDVRAFASDSSVTDGPMDFVLPKGFIDGVAYAELIGIPEGRMLTSADFDIGSGAPCLILRSDEYSCNYYIPLADIKDLI